MKVEKVGIPLLSVTLFTTCCLVILILPFIDGNWNSWNQATCMPDHCFCEKPRDGLLRQPVNTWTNMFFVLFGLTIINQVCLTGNELFNYYSLIYGLADIILGIGSAYYHASLTFSGQFLDNMGMQLVILWCFCYNFVRLTKYFRTTAFLTSYIALVLITGFLNVFVPESRRYLFGGIVALLLCQQIFVDFKIKPWKTGMNYIFIGLSLLCFLVAFGVWILDLQKIVCEEISFLQLHGIWHFLCSAATYSLFLFYNSEKMKPQFSNSSLTRNEENYQVNIMYPTTISEGEQEQNTPQFIINTPSVAESTNSTSMVGMVENFICCDEE
eukprot:gene10060-2483_t